jgi:hypothetical protein
MVGTFPGFLQTLESYGLLDALLPFLLIFTIIFAILQKTKFLGEEKKNFNVVIAMVIALIVVLPHVTNTYPPDGDVVDIINRAIPNISIIIIAIVMLLVLVGIWGTEVNWAGSSLSGFIALASFIGIIYVFGVAAGWFQTRWFRWLGDSDTQAAVLIILVFGVLIWYITKEPGKAEKAGALSGFAGAFKDFFKK